MKITIEDIAEKVGTTKSTVSKVLNNKTDVSESIKQQVWEVANELGYDFSRLNKKKICVYIINMAYKEPEDFGYDIIKEFKRFSANYGYNVVVKELLEDYDFSNYEKDMKKGKFAGSFILGLNYKHLLFDSLRKTTFPTILLDNVVRNNQVAYVGSDNQDGMWQAVKYLKKCGHSRIALYNGYDHMFIALQRKNNFKSALARAGLNANDLIVEGDFYPKDSKEEAKKLLNLNPTAIICASDLMAVSLIEEFKKKGMILPKEMSIIGIDNLPICTKIEPKITTLEQSRKDLGSAAFLGLNSLIAGVKISAMLIKTELIIRESVAKV